MKNWPPFSIDNYRFSKFNCKSEKTKQAKIIKNADLVKEINDHYFTGCYQLRNVWMVDRSNLVIAVFNGQKSGTKNTIDYAKGSAKLYVYDFKEDKKLYEKEFTFSADKNSVNLAFSVSYEEIEKLLGKSTVIICDAQSDIGNDRAFLLEKRFSDLDIKYTDVEIINRNEDEITVKAEEFTPFVMLDEEYILEDNCFMLRKGETKTVKIIKM